jgi:hemolysin III
MEMEKSRRNQIMYEVWNAITHGLAFLVSAAMVVLLLMKAVEVQLSAGKIASLAIYGATLLLLYLASTLFHCLAFTRAKRVFQIFDHSNIFLLIAGTYTPYCIIFVGGWSGSIMLTAIWIMAIAGIITHIWSKGRHQKIETTIYVVMGWMCLLAGRQLYINLTPQGFWLLVAGGVTFTVGAVIYSFPKLPGLHLIWHVFVMAGTALMFGSIYLNL